MNFFTAALSRREHLGLNSILLFLGPRGVGKSYGCLKVAEMRDPSFVIDRVIFDLESFLDILKTVGGGYRWLIFDEMGLEIPAREWLSTANKIMSYVTQSFRFTKVNLAISTPSPDYVDIHTRQLADFWMVCQTRGKIRVYSVKHNPFGKSPVQTPFLGELYIGLPSKEIQEAYESKRKNVLEGKYSKYLEQVKSKREKEEKAPKDLFKEALELYNEGKLFGTTGRTLGKISAYRIMEELGISQAAAYALKHRLEETVINKS